MLSVKISLLLAVAALAPGPPASSPLADRMEQYDALLSRYVSPRGVRYGDWRRSSEDRRALREVVAFLQKRIPGTWSVRARYALYINLYNAKVLNLLTSKWVEVQRTGTTCAVSPAHLSSSNTHRLSTLRRLLAAAEQAPQPERGLLGGRRQRQGNTAQGEIPEEPVNQAFTPQIA